MSAPAPPPVVEVRVDRAPRGRSSQPRRTNRRNNPGQGPKRDNALEQKTKQLQGQVNQLLAQKQKDEKLRKTLRKFRDKPIVASAADDLASISDAGMTKCGQSAYLKSILLPELGAVDVPDDVMRMHTLRSESVTYTLKMVDPTAAADSIAPVSGLLLLYPNHPTQLVGYNYVWSVTDEDYILQTSIKVAQELSASYDYGRRTSQVLYIRSSTLPSGMYAINGTMNAARIEGTVSEVGLASGSEDAPDQNYALLLSNTVNVFDKAGNVSVGDGIAVLSLPDSFVNPYMRLGDSSPAIVTLGTSIGNAIVDGGQDLVYRESFYNSNITASGDITDPPVGILNITFNFDSTNGLQLNIPYNITVETIDPGLTSYQVTCEVTLLDPFGNTIALPPTLQHALVNLTTVDHSYIATGVFVFNVAPDDIQAPIAAIAITSEMSTSKVGGVAPGDLTIRYDIQATAPAGARTGVNNPVVIVAYQNIAAGSVLNVTGISNFELIPNPELRRNIEIDYGKHDVAELEYVKHVLSNRHKYNIRSVYSFPEYDRLRPAFNELCDIRGPGPSAQAMGWGDIWDFAKKTIVPALGNVGASLFPAAAPLIRGVGRMISESASGNPILLRPATARAADRVRAACAAGGLRVTNDIDRLPTIVELEELADRRERDHNDCACTTCDGCTCPDEADPFSDHENDERMHDDALDDPPQIPSEDDNDPADTADDAQSFCDLDDGGYDTDELPDDDLTKTVTRACTHAYFCTQCDGLPTACRCGPDVGHKRPTLYRCSICRSNTEYTRCVHCDVLSTYEEEHLCDWPYASCIACGLGLKNCLCSDNRNWVYKRSSEEATRLTTLALAAFANAKDEKAAIRTFSAGYKCGAFDTCAFCGRDPCLCDTMDHRALAAGKLPKSRLATPRSLAAKVALRQLNARALEQAQKEKRPMPTVDGLAGADIKLVPFPTILVDGLMDDIGFGLYVVARGFSTRAGSAVATDSEGKHKLYGYRGVVPFPLKFDVSAFPIDPVLFAQGKIVPFNTKLPLEGPSIYPALWVLNNVDFEGVYPLAITGDLRIRDGKAFLQDFPTTKEKLRYTRSLGIPLAAANPAADYDVKDINLLKTNLPTFARFDRARLYDNTTATRN